MIYFQNSGLGNAINPLISIAHKKVYSIPLILLIGWRGAPNTKDEAQHITKGKITTSLLSKLNIKYVKIDSEKDFFKIKKISKEAVKSQSPVALLIKNNRFLNSSVLKKNDIKKSILRSFFIEKLLNHLKKNDKVISTTGYTSRELFQIRKQKKNNISQDFYMVGGMGHASSVALGCALEMKKNSIICLDGDGSMLMHLGSLFTFANQGKKNLKYIVLNNNSHESVGRQKTNAININLKLFSKSLRFKNYMIINSTKNIDNKIKIFLSQCGPNFLEVRIKSLCLSDLGRPGDFIKIKKTFLKK